MTQRNDIWLPYAKAFAEALRAIAPHIPPEKSELLGEVQQLLLAWEVTLSVLEDYTGGPHA